MKRWDYCTFSDSLSDSQLKDLGARGWEMVTYNINTGIPSTHKYVEYHYIFKRKVTWMRYLIILLPSK